MDPTKDEHLISRLAKFCTNLEFANLPEAVVDKVKQCVLDILGIFVAGSCTPTSKQVAEYVRQVAGQPESLIIGHGFRADMCNAAFANGTFGHSIEMDEQHNPSITHPSPVLVATGLAVGEREGVNGKELITAIVAGYEVMIRVGMAVAPSILVDRGFHPTAVTEYIKFPTGESENPMSKEALREKFRSLVTPLLPAEKSRHIESAVEGLEEIENIRKLTQWMAKTTKTRI